MTEFQSFCLTRVSLAPDTLVRDRPSKKVAVPHNGERSSYSQQRECPSVPALYGPIQAFLSTKGKEFYAAINNLLQITMYVNPLLLLQGVSSTRVESRSRQNILWLHSSQKVVHLSLFFFFFNVDMGDSFLSPSQLIATTVMVFGRLFS